jgi:hypothetical protein
MYYYKLLLLMLGGMALTWIIHELTFNKWLAFASAMITCIILWRDRKQCMRL